MTSLSTVREKLVTVMCYVFYTWMYKCEYMFHWCETSMGMVGEKLVMVSITFSMHECVSVNICVSCV